MTGTMAPMPLHMTTSRPPPGAAGKREKDARAGVSPAPRVAIVEDELMVAWSFESIVEDMGYEVVGLYSAGEPALAALGREPPDLVLMDINLGGGIDGIETARRLRAAHPVTILFVSAYADPETRARIVEIVPGAPLLRKPVSPQLLEQTIRDLVETSR